VSGASVPSYYYATTPPVAGGLPSHVANNHLIPATEDVAQALDRVRIGDLVTLQGKLVDVEIRDPHGQVSAGMRTIMTRDDVGSGASEIVWVESVELLRNHGRGGGHHGCAPRST
jgi:hypothetical protein